MKKEVNFVRADFLRISFGESTGIKVKIIHTYFSSSSIIARLNSLSSARMPWRRHTIAKFLKRHELYIRDSKMFTHFLKNFCLRWLLGGIEGEQCVCYLAIFSDLQRSTHQRAAKDCSLISATAFSSRANLSVNVSSVSVMRTSLLT